MYTVIHKLNGDSLSLEHLAEIQSMCSKHEIIIETDNLQFISFTFDPKQLGIFDKVFTLGYAVAYAESIQLIKQHNNNPNS